mmetsp:Transcript_7138/g.23902  ORF Transcript_7138/g.23902 Transcript_7138/m.23902 type:complete len:208 (-) Transcript_7138:22-645(-)
MFSATVSPSSNSGSWDKYPILIPGSKYTSPSNAVSTPAKIFINVDLPAPFAPKIPIFAPKYMPRLIFLINSFPVGVTLRTLFMLKIIFRVSVWYAEPDFTSPGDLYFPADAPPPPPPDALPPPPPGGGAAPPFRADFFPARVTTRAHRRAAPPTRPVAPMRPRAANIVAVIAPLDVANISSDRNDDAHTERPGSRFHAIDAPTRARV